jgi:hypothetical protein
VTGSGRGNRGFPVLRTTAPFALSGEGNRLEAAMKGASKPKKMQKKKAQKTLKERRSEKHATKKMLRSA